MKDDPQVIKDILGMLESDKPKTTDTISDSIRKMKQMIKQRELKK